MPKQKASYEALLEEVVESLKHSPDGVNDIVESSAKYVDAANDLTKDELALISFYVKLTLKSSRKVLSKAKAAHSI